MRIAVLNPLGGALGHYTDALCQTLRDAGAEVVLVRADEPVLSGRSAPRWVAGYLARVHAARRRGPFDEVIATWATLGHADLVLLRAVIRQVPIVVMHDPAPLVHARGYGAATRAVVGHAAMRSRVIVHSHAARTAHRSLSASQDTLLPLPMRRPAPSAHRAPGVVRVVGQFKADRDLQGLMRLRGTGPPEWTYEIVGRGWPQLPGWTVRAGFVSEADFTAAIATAGVVVIPYRRFFQSHVAVRCLELGVPFVGPADSSLVELVPPDCGWLVGERHGWIDALRVALASPSPAVERLAVEAYGRARLEWHAWMTTRQCSRVGSEPTAPTVARMAEAAGASTLIRNV